VPIEAVHARSSSWRTVRGFVYRPCLEIIPSRLGRVARRGLGSPPLAVCVLATSTQRRPRRLPPLMRHGLDSPGFGERVWIDPSACSNVLSDVIHRRHSGECVAAIGAYSGSRWAFEQRPTGWRCLRLVAWRCERRGARANLCPGCRCRLAPCSRSGDCSARVSRVR
jgi:hypothetical protein